MFYDRTDPMSENYAKWLTKDQLGELTVNRKAVEAVERFLEKFSDRIERISSTKYGEFFNIRMPVGLAEEIFQTEFYEYKSENHAFSIVKTEKYTIPYDLAFHLTHIEHITHFPRDDTRIFSVADKPVWNISDSDLVTPELIRKTYKIPKHLHVKSKEATQSLFESIGQQYSPSDLRNFQKKYHLRKDQIANQIGPNDPSQCPKNVTNCIEANLDVQYMMAIAQKSPTWYWNIPAELEPFAEWIIAVNELENPPLVHSVSYGNYETDYPLSKLESFNIVAQKLGLRGVSIFVSSGDDGVANAKARSNSSYCGYFTSFPTSSPFVTSVGATQGPESGLKEIACSSRTNGSITTGGGLSAFFAVPKYQKRQVDNFLNLMKGRAVPGYPYGRATPDVSALGHNYVIVNGNKFITVSGTSASSPVFAAMITLINDARIQMGKKSLGFLNFCVASHHPGTGCCKQGFYAIPGWDAVTGLGTPVFPKLKKYLLSL
jgi:tripeptidyl-peptidase-1